ncbi:2OG-Fe(II) oxygenase [Sessilibacter sp. MAH4]
MLATINHNEMLPLTRLRELADSEAEAYQTAAPFAHGVYDNVFSPELLDAVIEEFEEGEKQWRQFESKYEKKLQMNQDEFMQPITRAFIHNLNSEPFLRFLEKLTGIEGLIPDPYLVGAGLHKIPPGGKLGVHVDFNKHSHMDVVRRINVLIYLNKNWKEEYGGYFELWDEKKSGCQKKILPVFNRMAIFSTTATSFHGHPEPLTCPEDRCRISLALYYYTSARGEQQAKAHSTQFLNEDGKREELKFENSFMDKIKRKLGFH